MTDRDKPPILNNTPIPSQDGRRDPRAQADDESAALMAMAEHIMQKRRKVLKALAQ